MFITTIPVWLLIVIMIQSGHCRPNFSYSTFNYDFIWDDYMEDLFYFGYRCTLILLTPVVIVSYPFLCPICLVWKKAETITADNLHQMAELTKHFIIA